MVVALEASLCVAYSKNLANSLQRKELANINSCARQDSPYSPQLPASDFQAGFFAKPASLPVCLSEPRQTMFAWFFKAAKKFRVL